MKKERIVDIIAFLFILLFIYTAASKLLRIEYFRAVIEETSLLQPFAGFIQWAVPLVEIFISVLLVTKKFRLLALYGCFILMVSFTAYIAGILLYSKQLPCACGGVVEDLGWRSHLMFNVLFAVLAMVGIRLERSSHKQSNPACTRLYLYLTTCPFPSGNMAGCATDS